MPNLKTLTKTPQEFFNILPEDWVDEIAPYWDHYSNSANIYGVIDKGKVVAGGIVFSTVSPDTKGYEQDAQKLFDKGYLYIAFLYVLPGQRGNGLGKFWMNEVKNQNLNQSYWLAIEDYELTKFYQPLGFEVIAQVDNIGTMEWILID